MRLTKPSTLMLSILTSASPLSMAAFSFEFCFLSATAGADSTTGVGAVMVASVLGAAVDMVWGGERVQRHEKVEDEGAVVFDLFF
jgi:hypothetical protein